MKPEFSETHPLLAHLLNAVRFIAYTVLRLSYSKLRFVILFVAGVLLIAAAGTAWFFGTFFPAAGLVGAAIVCALVVTL